MPNCNTWGPWNGLKSLAGYGTKNNSICWSGLNVNKVNQLKCLKTNKSAVPDDIHPRTL